MNEAVLAISMDELAALERHFNRSPKRVHKEYVRLI